MPLRDSVSVVTGAAGFVGASLVRRLIDDGATVHALIRPGTDRWRLSGALDRITIHDADLTDASAVRRAIDLSVPDVVFHLAKHRGEPARLDYREAYRHNLDATLNLLEAVQRRSIRRFVHAGSSLEYDLSRSPLRESDAPAPVTAHGVTKAAATLLAQHAARAWGVPAVVARLFTVYGPWEGPDRFVPQVMLAAIDGRTIGVTRAGLVHDWIHVDDAVDALVRIAVAGGVTGEVINVATGRESTNEDIVACVEALSGRTIARRDTPFPDRPWDARRWMADVTKARDLLGWEASIDLRAGLARTLAWFREHRLRYDRRHA